MGGGGVSGGGMPLFLGGAAGVGGCRGGWRVGVPSRSLVPKVTGVGSTAAASLAQPPLPRRRSFPTHV